MSSNDNYEDETDFLLKKAHEILDCGPKPTEKEYGCSLTAGGSCPLLSSAFKSLFKPL